MPVSFKQRHSKLFLFIIFLHIVLIVCLIIKYQAVNESNSGGIAGVFKNNIKINPRQTDQRGKNTHSEKHSRIESKALSLGKEINLITVKSETKEEFIALMSDKYSLIIEIAEDFFINTSCGYYSLSDISIEEIERFYHSPTFAYLAAMHSLNPNVYKQIIKGYVSKKCNDIEMMYIENNKTFTIINGASNFLNSIDFNSSNLK
jgi:hypothetical protein